MKVRVAANIDRMFADIPLLDRFDAAADAGFEGVEFAFPYDQPAPELKSAMLRNGLALVLISAPPPNYTGGARGFAAMPDRVERFRTDMARAFRYARAMNVAGIRVLAGKAEGAAAQAAFIDNLRWASEHVRANVTLTIGSEAEVTGPGAFLGHVSQAAEIVRAVGASNLGLQFHSAQDGDAFDECADVIKHVQIAEQPGGGLLEAMNAHGYKGWVTADFATPAKAAEATVAWQAALRAGLT